MSAINCAIISATPINHTWQDHVLIQLRMLELSVGKDHQQHKQLYMDTTCMCM